MGIPIPITKEDLEGVSGEAGLRPFPFSSNGKWTQHTAQVTGIEIFEGDRTDFLVIRGRNGEYGVRVSVQLDPDFISNDFGQDTSKQRERNKDRLVKALAAFDLATIKGNNVELEPSRFPKAVGKIFAFSIQGAIENNAPKLNERGYQRTNISFKGATSGLLPVVVPDCAANTGTAASCATNASISVDYVDDDIPF